MPWSPIIELRGAIPIGVGLGMGHWSAMLISIFGNLVPVPFIIIFIRRIFMWMRKKLPKLGGLVDRMEKKVENKKEFMYKWQLIGLVILVAIPLPGNRRLDGRAYCRTYGYPPEGRVPGYRPGRCNRRAFGDGDNIRIYRNFCITFFFRQLPASLHRIAQEG